MYSVGAELKFYRYYQLFVLGSPELNSFPMLEDYHQRSASCQLEFLTFCLFEELALVPN